MHKGRTAARARRALAAMVLGWLAALGGAVLLAPAASAGTTVSIGRTAPAPVTVHPGDTVTFVNGIAPLQVTVPGVVPITATAVTTEILGGPCGGHTLAPGAGITQTFSQTGTCPISYAYAVQGAALSAVQSLLPPLPSPTSLLVTVVQAASSAVASAVPPPPPAPVPAPAPVVQPAPAPAGAGGGSGATGPAGGGTATTGSSGAAAPVTAGAPAPAPQAVAAGPASALSPAGSGSGSSSGSGLPTGGPTSGLMPAGHGGASAPVARQLAGLIDPPLGDGDAGRSAVPAAATDGGSAPTLPLAALAAVVALSGVVAALVRTHLAARSSS